jgi:membrane-associated phospholipid phosphatase
MLSTAASAHPLWFSITRLGEAQMVLPATLAAVVWIARQADVRAMVWRWLVLFSAAVLLTTLSKIAFIGWGVGISWLDFTGISGHSLFAASAYPLLLRLLLSYQSPGWQRVAWIAGFALAAVVAVSRVMVGVHSMSEIVAGFALGSLVGLLSITHWRVRDVAPSLVMPLVVVMWFALHLPVPHRGGMPAVDTHGIVTRLALALAGRDAPYTRRDLHEPKLPLR